MKKLLWVLVLAGAAFFGYRWYTGWRAFKAYEGFAEAWVHENETAADEFGDAETVRHAFHDRGIRGTRGGGMMEALRGDHYEVESKTRTPKGDLELVVKQTVHFDPPGLTSAIWGGMYAHFRHTASVRKTPEGWRVVAFEPVFLDAGETRPRK